MNSATVILDMVATEAAEAVHAHAHIAHIHEIEHRPLSGTGYAVCSCGATQRVENGKTFGEWHACCLCVNGIENVFGGAA